MSLAQDPDSYFSTNQYLLGDLAYSLGKHMLTPYTSPNDILPGNPEFNAKFSSARVIIEHVMGILKSRWAALKNIRVQVKKKIDFAIVNKWIVAIFVLHNMTILLHDPWDEEDGDQRNGDLENGAGGVEHQSGVDLRNYIKERWGFL